MRREQCPQGKTNETMPQSCWIRCPETARLLDNLGRLEIDGAAAGGICCSLNNKLANHVARRSAP
jgi:hypothetical protein